MIAIRQLMTDDAPDFGAFAPEGDFRLPATAAGPLSGLTFAVKDLIAIAGRVTGGGNPDWLATHVPAPEHAPAVAALLGAGAALVGATISDELAFSLEGANDHYGTPINPAAPHHLPGGSSSGSAVAVAGGLADIALGTDTGGSVRVPAAFCGVHGFRPSHGAVSTSGVIPFAPSLDTVGWFARSAGHLRRAGVVLLPESLDPPIGGLLAAVDVFALADAPVAEAARQSIQAWAPAGDVNLLGDNPDALLDCYRILQGAEIWSSLGRWISMIRPRFGPSIAARFAEASSFGSDEIAAATPVREALLDRIETLIPPGTAVVLPTTPTLPLPRTHYDHLLGDFYRRALTINAVASLAGLPQVTLPFASVDGLPVGVSLIGARGSDRPLLDLAVTLSDFALPPESAR